MRKIYFVLFFTSCYALYIEAALPYTRRGMPRYLDYRERCITAYQGNDLFCNICLETLSDMLHLYTPLPNALIRIIFSYEAYEQYKFVAITTVKLPLQLLPDNRKHSIYAHYLDTEDITLSIRHTGSAPLIKQTQFGTFHCCASRHPHTWGTIANNIVQVRKCRVFLKNEIMDIRPTCIIEPKAHELFKSNKPSETILMARPSFDRLIVWNSNRIAFFSLTPYLDDLILQAMKQAPDGYIFEINAYRSNTIVESCNTVLLACIKDSKDREVRMFRFDTDTAQCLGEVPILSYDRTYQDIIRLREGIIRISADTPTPGIITIEKLEID